MWPIRSEVSSSWNQSRPLFVDDLASPSTGMIWLGNNDGFIFIGHERNEAFNTDINRLIDEEVAPEARNLKWFEGMGNHSGWDQTLPVIFNHRKYGTWSQKVYTLKIEDYQSESEPATPDGYDLQKITAELYENQDESINNISFLHSKIDEFWSSPKHFFSQGIGYCALHKGEMVSTCFSGFVADNVHGIDIETKSAHQGKKIAQGLAHFFVQECFKKDMIPYWDCMENNYPSKAIAESLGFNNVFNYVGYDFCMI
ncbi:RimJ/RimL family protein N-acetyltransferase [Cytobacillus purgationiresistens]|uniref:RimJ/RimL family protein N-acetyltransferase n=1 Tax=Cytobacillus purgationiresistens TaxID=863449 RepID=A0ABU0AK86_9BACI|nr:RimJ/RimL family protein N-acetyltransferase [Cytobacillus purgationiresistens]